MNKSPLHLLGDRTVRKRLAKVMALQCFRNTFLEDLHAGKVPSSRSGDYSDVEVRTPDGPIPWTRLSRLSDREMKRLMIEVVNQCYDFLTTMADSRFRVVLEALAREDVMPQWFDPPHAVEGSGEAGSGVRSSAISAPVSSLGGATGGRD